MARIGDQGAPRGELINYFARHPTAANLLMLVFVLLGMMALPDLRRETYPEFEPHNIKISASYPGAPTEIVDSTITQRIEDEIGGLPGISQMQSRSREGGVSIQLEVEDGVEIDGLLAEVKSAVDGIRDFPEDVDPPSVTASARMQSVASIAVTGPMSPQDLKLYCERLKRELMRYGGITQVAIAGFSTHRLLIHVDNAALARQGLTTSDVAKAVSAQSVDAPIGRLEARSGDILVRYSDKRTSAEQLSQVVIKGGATGGTVRLEDVAEVQDAFALEEEQTYFNGSRAGFLTVSKTESQDSLDLVAAVKEFLADQDTKKPDGVELTLTEDTASVIEDRLMLLLWNGVQGLALVFFTLWLFFGWRLAFWVGAGLPVSFLGACWVMLQLGLTLNMMTMLGLLVALGLLMDDAIVLSDNVAAHLERGVSPMDAAVAGVKEVAGGIFSSFATTVCVFVPLSAMDGRIGRTLQVIPFILVAVLAVSLVEAFLILPAHLGHSLKRPADDPPGRFRRAFNTRFEHVRERWLGGAVDFCIRHRHVTLGATLAVMLVSFGMVSSGKLRYQAFPQAEGDVVQFKLELSPGTSLETTKREIDRVVAAAWRVSEAHSEEQPDKQHLVRNVSARFNYNPDVEEPGPHTATVTVDLLSVEIRTTTLEDFTSLWRKETGPMGNAVAASFGAGGRRGPGGNPIDIRIEGDDLEQLELVSNEIKAWMSEFDGVFDMADNLQAGTTQVSVKLRDGAADTTVTGSTVAAQLRAALSGVSIEHLYERGEEYELFVELDRNNRDTLTDLQQFPILVAANTSVPLGSIAVIEPDRSFASINRINGVRTANVTGNIDRERANSNELMSRFRAEKVPELESSYPDVRFTLGGEAEESAQTLGSMGKGLLLGLFGIFILLSLQFRSYVEPVVVMLAIPFAFVGVVWGSVLLGAPLSSQSLLGFVSLAGVVVNDSILLVLFIKAARKSGVSAREAASRASRERFRAVLLTSATTAAGLIPLMFETSRQAQTLIPVAMSIVFGITASTVLVLVVLPAVYTILAELGLAKQEEDGAPHDDAPPNNDDDRDARDDLAAQT